jgi:hypothetical protein
MELSFSFLSNGEKAAREDVQKSFQVGLLYMVGNMVDPVVLLGMVWTDEETRRSNGLEGEVNYLLHYIFALWLIAVLSGGLWKAYVSSARNVHC